jgi:hypothetical protein
LKDAQVNEIGIAMKSIGEHRYKVIDSVGLQLVSFKKERGKYR